jgi:hypothetical protein
MMTCMPTRFLSPTGAHPANATPWLESAPHNLDACRSLALHTSSLAMATTGASLNGPAAFPVIPFRAQSDASAQHEQLSIPILLPR